MFPVLSLHLPFLYRSNGSNKRDDKPRIAAERALIATNGRLSNIQNDDVI